MIESRQIAVSLRRLTVPVDLNATTVLLSAVTPQGEIFIQHQRMIRNSSINLFREILFCGHSSGRLSFRIYSFDDAGIRYFQKELAIPTQDLTSLSIKPTSIQVAEAGYQLALDMWMFVESSEDLQSLTDRNYSQLDLPFENKEQPFETSTWRSQEIQQDYDEPNNLRTQLVKKRQERQDFCLSLSDNGARINLNRARNEGQQKDTNENDRDNRSKVRTSICKKFINEIAEFFTVHS